MVHAGPGFTAAPGDELTMRTLPVFFGVLELLLRAGVTTVAEAAFQDRVWRPRLTPFLALARVRVVQCVTDPEVAAHRVLRRRAADPTRRAHADPGLDVAAYARQLAAFSRLALDVPSLEVDTTAGYRPVLAEVAAFANG
jgi:predicted kinase